MNLVEYNNNNYYEHIRKGNIIYLEGRDNSFTVIDIYRCIDRYGPKGLTCGKCITDGVCVHVKDEKGNTMALCNKRLLLNQNKMLFKKKCNVFRSDGIRIKQE